MSIHAQLHSKLPHIFFFFFLTGHWWENHKHCKHEHKPHQFFMCHQNIIVFGRRWTVTRSTKRSVFHVSLNACTNNTQLSFLSLHWSQKDKHTEPHFVFPLTSLFFPGKPKTWQYFTPCVLSSGHQRVVRVWSCFCSFSSQQASGAIQRQLLYVTPASDLMKAKACRPPPQLFLKCFTFKIDFIFQTPHK